MSYFLQGFGVFLGVLAGTAITLMAAWAVRKTGETQQVKNLKFEMDLNIGKIDKFLEELASLRNAINGDTLNTYFGYFHLSRVVNITANAMFFTGLLYRHLTHEQIGKLQALFTELSPAGEKLLNDQITYHKQVFGQSQLHENPWTSGGKQLAVRYVDLWEGKFRDHKQTFEDVVESL